MFFSWLNCISTVIPVLYTKKKLSLLYHSCQSFKITSRLKEFISPSVVNEAIQVLLYAWHSVMPQSDCHLILRKADLVLWDRVLSDRYCIPHLLLTTCSQTALQASYSSRFFPKWSGDSWRRKGLLHWRDFAQKCPNLSLHFPWNYWFNFLV